MIGTIFAAYLQGLPIYDLQSAKFPPSIEYGFASLISVVIAKFFDGKYTAKNDFIEHIGRNAIFYYFGQGIGSSVNYFVVNMINLNNWIIKWILTYVINVIVTIFVAEVLALMYSKILKKIFGIIRLINNGTVSKG